MVTNKTYMAKYYWLKSCMQRQSPCREGVMLEGIGGYQREGGVDGSNRGREWVGYLIEGGREKGIWNDGRRMPEGRVGVEYRQVWMEEGRVYICFKEGGKGVISVARMRVYQCTGHPTTTEDVARIWLLSGWINHNLVKSANNSRWSYLSI